MENGAINQIIHYTNLLKQKLCIEEVETLLINNIMILLDKSSPLPSFLVSQLKASGDAVYSTVGLEQIKSVLHIDEIEELADELENYYLYD